MALALVALPSCGGGSSGSSTSQTSSPSQTGGESAAQPSKPLPGHPKIASKAAPKASASQPDKSRYGGFTRTGAEAAERRAHRRQRARRQLERKAGHAAPFLVPTGDNSIPTYGAEAPSSEQAAATASLQAYLQARAGGDWSAACAQMAATLQKQLALLAGGPGAKGEGCAGAYAKLASRVPASARANPLSGPLTAFRVKGDKAFALFYGPHKQQYMMPMVSEGGEWTVNQLEAITWPIGAPAASPR